MKQAPPSLNDNSNPQQGTGKGTRDQATTPPSSATSSVTEETKASETTMSDDKKPAQQQQNRAPRKINPTVKDARKLFVGGLPSDVTSEEFNSFFEQFDKVVHSVVMFDRITGRSRGFGFVTFENPAICGRLLGISHEENENPDEHRIGLLEMRGKLIEVKSAELYCRPSSPDMKAYRGSNTNFELMQPQQFNFLTAPYGDPPPFYPTNLNSDMAPVFGMYPHPMMMMPYEQLDAYATAMPPYQYNYPTPYGFVPVFYPEVPCDPFYGTPAYPESVM